MFFEELVEAVIILNMFLAFLVVVEDLYFYFKIKEDTRWSKLLYAGVGIAWFIRYILFYLQVHPFDYDDINAAVLILTTFTLLAMAVGANIRVMRDIGFKVIVDDIKAVGRWISQQ